MLEIHYYFTPILDHLEPFDQNEWHLHPIVTLPAAKALRDAEDLPKNVMALNACHDRLQKISLDYLTVNLHGRRQGRLFLLMLQEVLSEVTVLEYNDTLRHQILKAINVSTVDFMEYRAFAKKHLSLILKDFRENAFRSAPASLILTDEECLQVEECPHLELQHYLDKIKRTA